MKLVLRTVYVIGDWGDAYWQQRALEQAAASAGVSCLREEMYFPTRKMAEDFAHSVLEHFLAVKEGVVHSSWMIADARDQKRAMDELQGSGAPTFGADILEARRTSEAEYFREDSSVGIRFATEVRVGRKIRRTKTVTVEGEEFSRTVEETVWSSWYKGRPEMASVSVWPHEYLEAVEETP